LRIDPALVLANVRSCGPIDAVLDARDPFLGAILPLIQDDLRRLGIRGILLHPELPLGQQDPIDPPEGTSHRSARVPCPKQAFGAALRGGERALPTSCRSDGPGVRDGWPARPQTGVSSRPWRQTSSSDILSVGWPSPMGGGSGAIVPDDPFWWIQPHPCSTARLVEVIRAGGAVVVGHTAEAILASNEGQAVDRAIPLWLRVRSGDLMADPGPTGILTLLEGFPRLARVELQGFFLDLPFPNRVVCDHFARAVERLWPGGSRLPCLIASGLQAGLGPLPPRAVGVRVIGSEVVGWQVGQGMTATVSLEGWGVPLVADVDGVQVGVDLGAVHGWSADDRGATVAVGNEIGMVQSVQDHRLVIKVPSRPCGPAPWRTLLFGRSGDRFVPLDTWRKTRLDLVSFLLATGSPGVRLFVENPVDRLFAEETVEGHQDDDGADDVEKMGQPPR
jgi:hypothetical protein